MMRSKPAPKRHRLAALLLCLPLALSASLPSGFAPLAERLPAHAKQHLQTNWRSWQQLSATQKQTVRQRAGVWNELTPAQRAQLREHWQIWQQLSAAQRQQLQRTANAFQHLPVDERAALQAQFLAQDNQQQRGWLLGVELGADWPHLRLLLGQVPGEQRDALLAVLHTLSAEERAQLGRIARRTQPQHRDHIRQQLLQLPPAQRRAWLAKDGI